MSRSKPRTVRPKKKPTQMMARRRRVVAEQRVLLDRARLTIEVPNHKAGRADLHDRDDKDGNMLSGAAPRDFHVHATIERDSPFLWIGIDADPVGDDITQRTCFAVISGDELKRLAEDVLRCIPATKGGGR
jgi:hypothetical protein